jgi:hypothetical protein
MPPISDFQPFQAGSPQVGTVEMWRDHVVRKPLGFAWKRIQVPASPVHQIVDIGDKKLGTGQDARATWREENGMSRVQHHS